jgi:hypothetical protein
MIKRLLLFVLISLSAIASMAQWQPVSSYGYIWNRGFFNYFSATPNFKVLKCTSCATLVDIGYSSARGYVNVLDTTSNRAVYISPYGFQWVTPTTGIIGNLKWTNLSTSQRFIELPDTSGTVALTSNLPTAGYGLTGNLAVDTTKIGLKEWRFDVAKHGGDTSGTTDVSALVQSAINSGQKVIYFPKGKYLFSSTVQLKDSVTIIGDGRENSIIKLTTNITAFTLSHTLGGYGCQFRDFGFLGSINRNTNIGIVLTTNYYSPRFAVRDTAIAATTDQRGIYADTVTGVYVTNVGSTRLGGFVVTFKNCGASVGAGYTTMGTRGNQISACYFVDGYGGVKFDGVAEYCSVVNTNCNNGVYGAYSLGGNNRFVGNNFSNNRYGIYVGTDPNNGHGIIASNVVNHCDTAILLDGLTRGMLVANNYFLVGNIYFKNCAHLTLSANSVSLSSFIIENCTNTRITSLDNYQQSTIPWTITGEAPTITYVGKTANAFTLADVKNSQQLDIKHYNGHANISSRFIGIGVDSVSSWVGFYVNKTIGLNKDSLPNTTGKTWQLVIDTTTGQVMRQLVSPTDTSGLSSRIDAKADKTANINAQTGTTYTLLSSDNGKVLTFNNASAITLTVPTGLGAGFNCLVVQIGAGQVTFSASSTTINNRSGYTKTAGQYAAATIAAYAANTFVTTGDMQ